MKCRILRHDRVLDWLTELQSSGRRLIAPQNAGDHSEFRRVADVSSISLDYVNTRFPAKEWFFPRAETLFSYRYIPGGNGTGVELEQTDVPCTPQVLFGVRPCDAAGLTITDLVFGGDNEDSFYTTRRAVSTIVSVSCSEPAASCFCTSVGLSPTSSQGSDMLLTAVAGGDYLVEMLSPKGEQLLWETAHFFAAGVCQDKDQVTSAVEAKMASREELRAIDGNLGGVFDDPRWADHTRKCLGCGVCSFVCPTCHCFDIVDESDAWGGRRCRNWDACAFPLFTQHGSGHNPRPQQDARYRQRVLHKFKYFPETWERLMCVGCGRCISQCPVNLDIHQVAAAMGAARVAEDVTKMAVASEENRP